MLTDDQVVDVLQHVYYPNYTREHIACEIGVKLAPPKQKKELGAIDRWRYQNCREDATKAATKYGVMQAMQLCRERFDQ